MMNALPSMVFETDTEGHDLFFSERWWAYTGMRPDEFRGRGWLRAVHPDDADVIAARWSEAVRAGSPFESKHRVRAADGSYRWFITRALPAKDAQGKIVRWFGSLTDIDDLVRAERALRDSEQRLRDAEQVVRLAAQVTGFGTWDYWPQTGELIWSEQVKQWFGLPPDARPSYDLFLRALHPDDRERAHRAVQAALSPEGGGDYAIDYRVIGLERGEERWFHVRGKAFFDEHDRAVRLVGGGVDITEHKRLDELRDRLLGIVGHDLRGPLSAIKLATAMMLRRSALTNEDAEKLRTIARSADRMTRMIHQLLDFTRAGFTGGLVLERERVDLSELCQAIAKESELAHPDHPVRCYVSGDCSGMWDPSRLGEVLSNLLSNAARYGLSETPINVALHGEGADVVIEIHNEGAPIPEDILPRIFGAFCRGKCEKSGAAKASAGLGLGLYITKEIVAAHGGEIKARSTEHEGTTFTVRLPRA